MGGPNYRKGAFAYVLSGNRPGRYQYRRGSCGRGL